MRGLVTGAFGMLVALAAFAGSAAPTHADVVLVSQSVSNEFPAALSFRVSLQTSAELTQATLRYSVEGSQSSAFNRPDTLPPGNVPTVEVELVTNSGSSYIPVGTFFRYLWELEAADGSVLTTPEEEFLYLPPDQQWQSLANDFLEVWYHGDKADIAGRYLEAGTQTYDTMGRQLLQVELSQLPVRVILFDDESEMDPAKSGGGAGGRDEQITVCGQQVSPVIVFVIPATCGTGDITDTLRHEFTHALIDAAAGPVTPVPLWLNEGLAVLGQTEPGSGFVQPFDTAVRIDRLLPFGGMAGPESNPSLVGLYYGQSFFMVTYLLEREGPAAMSDLFTAMREGTRFDLALEEVYGVTVDEFESEFREAVGLPAAPAPTEGPTEPAERPAEATPTSGAPPEQSGGSSDDDGMSLVVIGAIGLSVLFALAAVMAFLMLTMAQRNRETASPAPAPAPAPRPRDPRQPLPPAWRPPEARSQPPPPAPSPASDAPADPVQPQPEAPPAPPPEPRGLAWDEETGQEGR